jgi:hypothetical protein
VEDLEAARVGEVGGVGVGGEGEVGVGEVAVLGEGGRGKGPEVVVIWHHTHTHARSESIKRIWSSFRRGLESSRGGGRGKEGGRGRTSIPKLAVGKEPRELLGRFGRGLDAVDEDHAVLFEGGECFQDGRSGRGSGGREGVGREEGGVGEGGEFGSGGFVPGRFAVIASEREREAGGSTWY